VRDLHRQATAGLDSAESTPTTTGRSAVFVVNRNLESPTTLTDEDIYATNSYEDPDRVRLCRTTPPASTTAGSRSSCPGLLDGHRHGLTASGRNADLTPVTTRGCGWRLT
jgi:hypothetical protein